MLVEADTGKRGLRIGLAGPGQRIDLVRRAID
jgi:hypothetical protein